MLELFLGKQLGTVTVHNFFFVVTLPVLVVPVQTANPKPVLPENTCPVIQAETLHTEWMDKVLLTKMVSVYPHSLAKLLIHLQQQQLHQNVSISTE